MKTTYMLTWTIMMHICLKQCFSQRHNVYLEPISTLYFPYSYVKEVPQYALDENAVEQLTYDSKENIVYVVGRNNIHVVNVNNVISPEIIFHMSVDNVDMTDVEVCGDFVLISMDNLTDRLDGHVAVYRKYNPAVGRMEAVHSIKVGALPDMLVTTTDCRTVVVAIEAEAFVDKVGQFVDPEGAVGILKFESSDLSGPYTYNKLDFKAFNDRWEELVEAGARFVFRERNNTFAQDIEPEYIALSKDEKTAYVVLQENNAIAEIDIEAETIRNIYPLGWKDWLLSGLDASDRDGDVKIRKWPVFGLYQPDGIKSFHKDGVDYLITANEGDSKEYPDIGWTEVVRMQDLTMSPNWTIPDYYSPAGLKHPHNMGRLKMTNVDGKVPGTDTCDCLYSFGARSFSIWRSDTMKQVYDSGSTMENVLSENLWDLFNANVENNMRPSFMWDSRSDDKGPECESVETGQIGKKSLIFIGNERPGSIAIFSIDDDITKPRFESVWAGVATTNGTWENLYDTRAVTVLDPEDMRFIPAHKSPSGEALLVVTGTVSGTVSLFKVKESQRYTSSSTLPDKSFSSILPVVFILAFRGLR